MSNKLHALISKSSVMCKKDLLKENPNYKIKKDIKEFIEKFDF